MAILADDEIKNEHGKCKINVYTNANTKYTLHNIVLVVCLTA